MSYKKTAKKVWNFVWKSDSPWSWLTDLILAFLLVRFVIFPVLGLILATSLPLVVVESGSMQHNGLDFDDWWQERGQWYIDNHNITQTEFQEWPLSNGFDKGDVIITRGKKEYEKGDIIIFTIQVQNTPIIHRYLNYDKNWQNFQTKGDNNPDQLIYEKAIKKNEILSSAWIRIPKIGWIKLIFVEAFRALA